MTRRARASRKHIDPRQVGAIAYVVDSGGTPVTHTWTPTGRRRKKRTTTIGIYRQETSLPNDEKGRHLVWSSDENHGDTYPWEDDDPQPYWLTKFMREAKSGQLSAAFAMTAWGRELANGPAGDGVGGLCKCRGGEPLREAERAATKKEERGGMNAAQFKKHKRRLAKKSENE